MLNQKKRMISGRELIVGGCVAKATKYFRTKNINLIKNRMYEVHLWGALTLDFSLGLRMPH